MWDNCFADKVIILIIVLYIVLYKQWEHFKRKLLKIFIYII